MESTRATDRLPEVKTIGVLMLAACSHSAPVPTPPVPTVAGNPCFAGQPSLAASEMYRALEHYAWSLYAPADQAPPPPTTYGSCKVDRNKVTTADGKLIAELGCGVRVLTRGIHDELGLEIGSRGSDLLAKTHATQPLECLANGPDQVRCRFDREPDTDTDGNWYMVGGSFSGDVLRGDDARAFLASRQILELDVSVWCH